MHTPLRFVAAFSALSLSLHASDLTKTDESIDPQTKVSYQKDQYDNLWILEKTFNLDDPKAALAQFLKGTSPSLSASAIMVNLGLESFGMAKTLKELGFHHHFTNDTLSEWVIKNASTMPEAMTSIGGGRVLLIKDECLLLTLDKGHTKWGRWNVPGGSQDPKELPLNTAVREIKEELGLTIKPQSLQLLAVMNRTGGNRYGANDHCYYYVSNAFEGEISLQTGEIQQARWVPLKDVAEGKKVETLPISGIVQTLVQHFLDNKENKIVERPDIRQAWKKPEDQDKTDVLHLNLFQHNCKL
jgi:8-oxo-dGTP diphosphatase